MLRIIFTKYDIISHISTKIKIENVIIIEFTTKTSSVKLTILNSNQND